MNRFKIRVNLDVDEAQGMQEIKKKIRIIEKKLKGVDLDLDTKQFNKKIDKSTKKAKKFNKQTKKMGTNLNKTKKATKESKKGFRVLGQNIFEAGAKFAIWTGLASMIYGAVGALKSLVTQSIKVETAMAEFEIVSDATNEQLIRIDNSANRLVSSLGALKTEVTKVSTEFARAGYNIADSMELAKQSIIGARVGFTSMEDVSTILISSMKAFNLTAQDSKNIINDLFVTSKESAVTFQGLGEAIRRSGNALQEAGASYDQALSLISAANESVQDPAKVGSALKTIQARLRGIDKDSNLPKLRGLLQSVNVEIENADGGFRNIYDILGDLSTELENSNDEFKKQLILEELAGKRRANILAGLVNNFSTAKNVLNQTSNSIKDATKAQQEMLETSAGQIKAMKGNWENFASAVVDSNAVSGVLQFLNKHLEEINTSLAMNKQVLEETGASGFRKKLASISEIIGALPLVRDADEAMIEFGKSIDDMSEGYKQLNEDIANASPEYIQELREELSPLQEEYNRVQKGMKDTKNQIENNNDALEKGKITVGEYTSKNQKLNEELTTLEDARDKVLKQLAEHNILGNDINNVMDKLSKTTEDNTEQVKNQVDAYKTASSTYKQYTRDFKYLTDDQINSMEGMIQADIDRTKHQIQNSKARISAIKAEGSIYTSQLNNVRKIVKQFGGAGIMSNKSDAEFLKQLSNIEEEFNLDALTSEEEKLQGLIDKLKGFNAEYDKYFGDDKDTDTDSTKKSKSEKRAEIVSDSIDELRDKNDDYIEDMEEKYEDDFETFKKNTEKKIGVVDDLIKELERKYEETVFEDEEQEMLDEITALKSEKEMLSLDKSLEANRRRYEIDKELSQKQDDLSDLRRDREYELEREALEDKKENLEDEIDARKEAYDKQLDALEEYEEKVNDKLDGFENQWDDFSGDLGQALEDGILPSVEKISNKIKQMKSQYEESRPKPEDPNTSGGSDTSKEARKTRASMSESDKRKIEKYKEMWDKIDRFEEEGKLTHEAAQRVKNKLHAKAEKIRAKYGFSGGDSGDEYDKLHDGGVVGGESFKNTNILDYMNGLKSNEQPIIAEVGETVITQDDMQTVANNTNNTANFDSLITINSPQIGGQYKNINEFSKKLTDATNRELTKLGITNIGRN